eukprot:6461466-Amphidinium_carterae.1
MEKPIAPTGPTLSSRGLLPLPFLFFCARRFDFSENGMWERFSSRHASQAVKTLRLPFSGNARHRRCLTQAQHA